MTLRRKKCAKRRRKATFSKGAAGGYSVIDCALLWAEAKTVHRAERLAQVDAQHKTKASVKALAEKVLEPLNSQKLPPLTTTTVGDFTERIYLPFVAEHKRPSTLRGYKQMWTTYLKARCGTVWLREVKTFDVQHWLEAVAREHGLSKPTLCHVKHFLSGMFRYAAQQDYFDSARGNPVTLAAVPANAPPASEGCAYSLEEIGQMLDVLDDRSATVVATAAYTGLRLGELRGLVWEAYAPAGEEDALGFLHVIRSVWRGFVGDPKTAKSKAPVPVIPELAERLNRYRRTCGNPISGPMFANGKGRPLNLDWLYWTQMKAVLKKAGVAWAGWHAFRRGLASNLNRLGVDDEVIQSILRHSNVATTQTHYIKTARPDAVAAMRKFSDALKCSNRAPESTRKTQPTVQ